MGKYLATLCAASVVYGIALAKPPLDKASNQKASSASKSYGYAQTPIAGDAESLPANFKGYQCSSITKSLSALNLKKDEFESQQQFDQRTAASGAIALTGSITSADPMAFVSQHSFFQYDAERQAFTSTVYFGRYGTINDANAGLFPAEPVETISQIDKQYEASNAYGAKAIVDSTSRQVCGVVLSTAIRTKSWDSIQLKIDFPMPSDEARTAKGDLKIVLLGAIIPPYIGAFYTSTQATISSPSAYTASGDAVVMRFDEAWVFNQRTGKIYAKVRPTLR